MFHLPCNTCLIHQPSKFKFYLYLKVPSLACKVTYFPCIPFNKPTFSQTDSAVLLGPNETQHDTCELMNAKITYEEMVKRNIVHMIVRAKDPEAPIYVSRTYFLQSGADYRAMQSQGRSWTMYQGILLFFSVLCSGII